MRTAAFRRATRLITGAAGLGAALLAALPASAAPHSPAAHAPPTRQSAQRGDRYNTGATHSPQVLRELAGRPGLPAAGKIAGALQGVDVASFQHPHGAAIDWAKVASSGIQFAAVKFTEGAYYQNPYAPKDLADASAAGLSVMAYAFAIPNGNGSSASPAAQADYLLSDLAKAGEQPPAILLDIEYNPYGPECYGLTQSAMVTWVAAFDAEIQAKTGQDPIIYTPPSWWQTCTGGVAKFRQVPLWVPDPNSQSSPILPAGWSNWAFWQYGTGTVSGIAATTDLDQLNPGLIPLLDPGFQHGKAGAPVTIQVTPADPVAGQVLTFSAAGLPPGISISATTGVITGAPTTAGKYRVIVRVTDSKGLSGSVAFDWTVH